MKLLMLAAASMLLIGCATKPQEEVATDDVRIFRTGSHLPQRDNQVPNVQSNKVQVIMNPQAPYIPSKGGAN